MNEVLYEEVNILEDRIIKLLSDLKRLKSENGYLRDLLQKKEDIIKDFQNHGKMTNIAEGKDNKVEMDEEMKVKIDESIRIIEKCIAQLSK